MKWNPKSELNDYKIYLKVKEDIEQYHYPTAALV